MLARVATLYFIFFLSLNSVAQTYSVTGHLADGKDNSDLMGVTVVVKSTTDTTYKNGNTTDSAGNFELDGLKDGTYSLHIE